MQEFPMLVKCGLWKALGQSVSHVLRARTLDKASRLHPEPRPARSVHERQHDETVRC